MERIRFLTHQGRRTLFIDLTNCPAEHFAKLCELVPSYVTSEPQHSVLLLADFTGSKVDREALEIIKKGVVFDRPHIKRSAWVGTEGLPKAFYEIIKAFSLRELPTFKTREEALDYLVADDQDETQELASPG